MKLVKKYWFLIIIFFALVTSIIVIIQTSKITMVPAKGKEGLTLNELLENFNGLDYPKNNHLTIEKISFFNDDKSKGELEPLGLQRSDDKVFAAYIGAGTKYNIYGYVDEDNRIKSMIYMGSTDDPKNAAEVGAKLSADYIRASNPNISVNEILELVTSGDLTTYVFDDISYLGSTIRYNTGEIKIAILVKY